MKRILMVFSWKSYKIFSWHVTLKEHEKNIQNENPLIFQFSWTMKTLRQIHETFGQIHEIFMKTP